VITDSLRRLAKTNKLKTQNPKLKTQNSKLKTQTPKPFLTKETKSPAELVCRALGQWSMVNVTA